VLNLLRKGCGTNQPHEANSNLDELMRRAISNLLIFVGTCVYAFLLYIATVEWNQDISIHESRFEEMRFIVGASFAAGLPPLIVAISCLLFSKSTGQTVKSVLIVLVFVVFHWITLVFVAHGTVFEYLPLSLIEFVASILVAVNLRRILTPITTELRQ